MSTASFVSAARLEELKKELEELKNVRRKEIAKRIEEAKALGDLSENAEYMEAREEQAFNEGKIKELEEVIRHSTIIAKESVSKNVVGIGSVVTVIRNGSTEQELTIVGSREADPLNGKISNESPIGQALLGRTPNEEVKVHTPSGEVGYKVIKIK